VVEVLYRRQSPADPGRSGSAPFSKPPPLPQSEIIGLFPEPGGAAVSVAIIDYGSGNLHSAAKAFERAARGMENRGWISRSSSPMIRLKPWYRADRIVLPGVGAFADCRRGLDALAGMIEALDGRRSPAKARPFFGICVGMQLMADARPSEHVKSPKAFNWIAGDVDRIAPSESENSENPAYGMEYARRRARAQA
jgi:glutamine amidotransferase